MLAHSTVDSAKLGRWLDSQGAPGPGEEPVLEQLKGGSQNTLYLVRRGGERGAGARPRTAVRHRDHRSRRTTRSAHQRRHQRDPAAVRIGQSVTIRVVGLGDSGFRFPEFVLEESKSQ